MGTYIYAYVEHCDGDGDPPGGRGEPLWWTDAEWDLGKSYELMSALSEGGASEGWPKDTTLHHDEEASDCYAKQTSTPEQLRAMSMVGWLGWEAALFSSLLASIEPLERYGWKVRVLWGRS